MTNTTEEYWDVDGNSLNNVAFNIQTLGGRSGVPPLRGTNQSVAFRRGQKWREKTVDQRTQTLAMWVRGCTEAGAVPSSESAQRTQFNDNWKKLQRMFTVEGRELVLTKRLRTTAGGLLVLDGKAELASTMDPTMFSRVEANFVVDLIMADPYFYGAQQVVALTGGGSVVHSMPGDANAHGGVWRITNTINNARLTNSTTGHWVQLTLFDNVGGHYYDIDFDAMTAVRDDGLNVAAAIEWNDDKQRWMELAPGNKTLVMSGSAVTPTLTYRPPFF